MSLPATFGTLSRRLKSGIAIPIRVKNGTGYMDSSSILAFRIKARKTYAVTPSGEIRIVRGMTWLKPRLKKLGGWVPIGRNYTVNMHLVLKIGKQRGISGYMLTFTDGTRLNLLPGYEKPFKKFFEAEELDRIKPLSRPFEYLLKMGVRTVATDIRFTPTAELKKIFSTVGGQTVIASDLIASFLWQSVNYIRQGKPSIVANKNVRSLWYAIQPTLGRMGIYSDHYKTLCEQLSEMALQGILSYREFNLREEGKWALGLYNPHVVVLNEKTADDIGLKFIQDQIGISYLATGGQPSTLTMEYFTHALKKKLDALDEMPPLVIIAIVDYDPYGWLLRETAINAMINFGLPRPDAVINIALPKNYPQDLLHFLKNDLTKGKYKVRPAILRKWMKITNGIDGEPFGIPINYLWEDLENIKNLVLDDAKPYLLLQPPMPTRPWEEVTMHMEQLHELAMFTIQKMMRRTKACKK